MCQTKLKDHVIYHLHLIKLPLLSPSSYICHSLFNPRMIWKYLPCLHCDSHNQTCPTSRDQEPKSVRPFLQYTFCLLNSETHQIPFPCLFILPEFQRLSYRLCLLWITGGPVLPSINQQWMGLLPSLVLDLRSSPHTSLSSCSHSLSMCLALEAQILVPTFPWPWPLGPPGGALQSLCSDENSMWSVVFQHGPNHCAYIRPLVVGP